MRASRPGECAGRAWRDYSGRAAVRRSKRCDLVTPKAKRKVARVARPTADHVERARRRTNDTLLNTFRLPTEVCSDFLRSGTSAIRCLSRQKQTPDEWNCTKARGTAAHALRFGTLLKPSAKLLMLRRMSCLYNRLPGRGFPRGRLSDGSAHLTLPRNWRRRDIHDRLPAILIPDRSKLPTLRIAKPCIFKRGGQFAKEHSAWR